MCVRRFVDIRQYPGGGSQSDRDRKQTQNMPPASFAGIGSMRMQICRSNYPAFWLGSLGSLLRALRPLRFAVWDGFFTLRLAQDISPRALVDMSSILRNEMRISTRV